MSKVRSPEAGGRAVIGVPVRSHLTSLFERFREQLELQAREIERARRFSQLARAQLDGPLARKRR